jgi:HSP20 family molecular chaperone IbpA
MTFQRYQFLANYWQRAFQTPAGLAGWSDYRCTSYLEFSETTTHYYIVTNFYGLSADNLTVRLQGQYLIVEGDLRPEILGRSGYGRYVRHVPILSALPPRFTEITFGEDGTLSVKLQKPVS